MEQHDSSNACGSLTESEYATAADGSRPQSPRSSLIDQAAAGTPQAASTLNACEIELSILHGQFDNYVKAGGKVQAGEVARQGIPGLMIFLPGVRIPESGFWTLNHDQKG